MGEPDEARQADEFVEPLFAGLRGADPDPAAGAAPPPDAPVDPWTHTARPRPAVVDADPDAETGMARLYVKAVLLVLALTALATLFYLVFGV